MGTKNLSRSAIEGGRTKSNKWNRRDSHNAQRTSERDYCQNVKNDPESYDVFDFKEKTNLWKEFHDKLGPMYRWLHSQVGRSWNDVHSDIIEKFDTRTTSGRHIVYDHLLSSVEEVPDFRYRKYYYGIEEFTSSSYKNDFYVDGEGLLQCKKYIPRANRHYYVKVPKFNTEQIANWLSGRVVGKLGKKFFWFIIADKNKKYGGISYKWISKWSGTNYYNKLCFYYLKDIPNVTFENGKEVIIGYKSSWTCGAPCFRQDRKLNEKELKYWNSIPEYYQNKILDYAPTNINSIKPEREIW